jgi:hypothetical protein
MRWPGRSFPRISSSVRARSASPRERDVEAIDVQAQQAGQQLRELDLRVLGATGAQVRADARAFVGREAREREVVQIDEAGQQHPARV